jgi:transposase
MKEEDKQTIIRLKGIDRSWKNIGEAVDKKPDTCKKFYQRYRLIKDLPPKTIISKSKITAPIGLKIKQEVRDNPRVSVRKLVTIVNGGIDDENSKISKTTIQRYLTNNGLVSKTVKHRPILRAANVLRRFEFGKYIQEQLNIDPGFLNKILWSDETMISCYSHKRKMVVRVHHGVKEEDLPLNPAVQGGGFNVMFFGSFSKNAFGQLAQIEGKINAEKYIGMVKEYIEPELEASEVPMIFMQDNAPCHKARVTMDYLCEKNIKTFDWPPQSPDLNPIEHIWAIIKQKLYDQKDCPKNRNELIDRVFTIWENLDEGLLTSLTNHAMRRFHGVVAKKGGWLGNK